MVQHGWPESREEVPVCIREYFIKSQHRMLQKAHSSHQGAEACIWRARDSLFWPGMTVQIQEHVSKCATCNAYQPKQQKEKMMPWEIPSRPWEIMGQDLFT